MLSNIYLLHYIYIKFLDVIMKDDVLTGIAPNGIHNSRMENSDVLRSYDALAGTCPQNAVGDFGNACREF